MAEDTTSTITQQPSPQPTQAQPSQGGDKKDNSQKGMLIGLGVIAVIAILLAGFFFVSAKQSQKTIEEQNQAVEEATIAAQENAQQAAKEQAEKEAEMAKMQAELEAQLEAAQEAVNDLNDQIAAEGQTQLQQCQTLLVTMPSDKVVTFRSDNWEVDIVKYYKDMEAEQKTYDEGSDEWDNLGLQKRVTEPYSTNFLANCEDVYDENSSTIVASTTTTTTTTPAASPTP